MGEVLNGSSRWTFKESSTSMYVGEVLKGRVGYSVT
jgi:hypothetical protein